MLSLSVYGHNTYNEIIISELPERLREIRSTKSHECVRELRR